MSTSLTALEKYTKAIDERNKHIEDNKKVFDEHTQILMKIIDAENELRDAVAEEKASIENGAFKVIYTPQTQTYADIETIDQYVASGILTPEIRNNIVKTQDRPGRITISAQKN